jgi:linoleoyl-CoA desaturase
MTIFWFVGKDIPQMIRYKKRGLLAQQKSSFKKLMTNMIISKVAYGILVLALPLLLVAIPWWQTLIFFMVMHLIAGLLLGLVFQPAHIITDTSFPLPDEKGKIENNWVIHQLMTTANYAPKGAIFSWLVGGLNFQIEHHLFANVCHVHYRKISHIVRDAAAEFGLPYHSNPTFFRAIANHAKMLKNLGKYENALA